MHYSSRSSFPKKATGLIWDLVSLIYPEICVACHIPLYKNEKVICVGCRYYLPKTYFHFMQVNPISKLFWGRTRIHAATAYYYFRKGSKVQELVHSLKYKGRQDVGITIGNMMGFDLQKSALYDDIDMIVSVPLHPSKERKRGYNQSDCFALGLSNSLDVQFNQHILKRTKRTSTQTKKKRFDRWKNVSGIFEVENTYLIKDKHVLLVDDLITTGSTLEASANALYGAKVKNISVATIGFADVS